MHQGVIVPTESLWMKVGPAHRTAREIADRHYSRKKPGSSQFAGPGEKIVLLSYDLKALFVWRKSKYREDGQEGVECAIFRNEGELLSSELIRAAERWAWERWPGERLFTYVDGSKIKSTNPGHCFIMAAWERVNGYRSKDRGLFLLEKSGGSE